MLGPSKEHIEIVEGGLGPKPVIEGHRIRVEDVKFWHEQQGMSVAEIVEHFPQLTKAEVHAALAYYWDYRDELERKWAEDDAWSEEYMQEYKRTHPSELQERLKRLRGG